MASSSILTITIKLHFTILVWLMMNTQCSVFYVYFYKVHIYVHLFINYNDKEEFNYEQCETKLKIEFKKCQKLQE